MIEAAGGVVWRTTGRCRVDVLIVHRPRRGDWSLPKGKLRPFEPPVEGAVREVREETGLRCDVGEELPSVTYVDRKGRPKSVRYWSMQERSGRFRPIREVDRVQWVRIERVGEMLTYHHDLAVVEGLVAVVEEARILV